MFVYLKDLLQTFIFCSFISFSPPPSTSIPRKLNNQELLGKTDNHWMDKTNTLKIAVQR